MEIVKELLQMFIENKKIWLIPIVLIFLALGGLMILVQGTVVAPFIYTLF